MARSKFSGKTGIRRSPQSTKARTVKAKALSILRGKEKGRAYQSDAFSKAVNIGLTGGGAVGSIVPKKRKRKPNADAE